MQEVEITRQLWDRLWQDYSRRVEYARIYEQTIREAGGAIANDHIAFRSLRLTVNQINLGIPYIAKIAEALGYEVAGEYHFPDRFLYARHYRHREQERFDLPKLFISELIVEALPVPIARHIEQSVSTGNFCDRQTLQCQIETASNETEIEQVVSQLEKVFVRPWQPPKYSVVESVNQVSQYGAWVLLHGYAVNHFTGYVNRHHTSRYPDIETTVRGLIEEVFR